MSSSQTGPTLKTLLKIVTSPQPLTEWCVGFSLPSFIFLPPVTLTTFWFAMHLIVYYAISVSFAGQDIFFNCFVR